MKKKGNGNSLQTILSLTQMGIIPCFRGMWKTGNQILMAGRKNAHVFGTNLIRVPLLEQGIFCTISDAITLNFLVCVKLRFNLIMKKKTLVTAIINTIILRLLFKSLLKLKLLSYCKSFTLQCFFFWNLFFICTC